MEIKGHTIKIFCTVAMLSILATSNLYAQNVAGLSTDLMNDFTKNDEWTAGIIEHQDEYRKLEIELSNQGLKELDKKELKHRDDYQTVAEKMQELLDKELSKDIGERYNSRANNASFPRATYDLIDLELTDTFEETSHIPFRDVFSSDKGQQYKYFASPLVSLTATLLDLPQVKLEQARKTACTGTSCDSNGGSGSTSTAYSSPVSYIVSKMTNSSSLSQI